MFLKNIKFTNFRNYDDVYLEFSDGVNIIYGNNGLGKTNILEAIYISAITKSYRTLKDSECIKFSSEYANIECEFENEDRTNKIEIYIDNKNTKQIKEDGLKVKKYTEFIGKYPIVMFSPDDMEIVKGAPKNRRKFLDILISQISKKYVVTLAEYKKAINIKNNLLKLDRDKIDINYLKILNEKIANYIVEIVDKRNKYIEKLCINSNKTQKEISKGKEELNLVYSSEFDGLNYEQTLRLLNNSIENDIFKKTSTKGIGHDDILILVNDKEVSKFGSQGQNRTALLAMKIAEFEILKEEKQIIPMILLDDVFSELDRDRINFLIDYISSYQVFITTTEIDSINNISNKEIFKIENGTVEKIKN